MREKAGGMGRQAFLTSAAVGLGGLITGCIPSFGPGGTGTRSVPEPGPDDAAEVIELAQVADLPDGTGADLIEQEPPEGYEWAREVVFSASAAAVDEWLMQSFGSADAAQPVHVLNPVVAEAFEVEEVPSSWRSLRTSVEGTTLELMLLIDDADPTTVRLHLRRRSD